MIIGLDHVQLAMPSGGEDAARRFYGGVLGLACADLSTGELRLHSATWEELPDALGRLEPSEVLLPRSWELATFPVDPIKAARCALACKPRSGYAACLARCIALGEVCDGGVDNCTPL